MITENIAPGNPFPDFTNNILPSYSVNQVQAIEPQNNMITENLKPFGDPKPKSQGKKGSQSENKLPSYSVTDEPQIDYLAYKSKQTTSPSIWVSTPNASAFYNGIPERTPGPFNNLNSNDSIRRFDSIVSEIRGVFGLLNDKSVYFDDLVKRSYFNDLHSNRMTNRYFENITNYGTPITYGFLRDDSGTQTSGANPDNPEYIMIWIPERGPPIEVIKQVVTEFLEGQKYYFDELYTILKKITKQIKNSSVVDILSEMNSTVEFIKKHIDSYFSIDNNFEFYIEQLYYRFWPENMPTTKELLVMRELSDKLQEMKRIYKDNLYNVYNHVINTEKRRFDKKKFQYESQDRTLLQSNIIEIFKLNTKDEPFIKGTMGKKDIPEIKGPITRLSEMGNSIRQIYIDYQTKNKLDNYAKVVTNKKLENYTREAGNILMEANQLQEYMKTPEFINVIMGDSLPNVESPPVSSTLITTTPAPTDWMLTSPATLNPADWTPTETSTSTSTSIQNKQMDNLNVLDESQKSNKRFRKAYKYLDETSDRMATRKGDNWNLNVILRLDMIYDYYNKKFIKFYPDNGAVIDIDPFSNSEIFKIPEKDPPIDNLISLTKVCLKGMKREADESLKTIKYEVNLYPNNDYSYDDIEFKLENADTMSTHIKEYINNIPDSSIEKYAYDVYYKCWPNEMPSA